MNGKGMGCYKPNVGTVIIHWIILVSENHKDRNREKESNLIRYCLVKKFFYLKVSR